MSDGQGGEIESEAHFPLVSKLAGENTIRATGLKTWGQTGGEPVFTWYDGLALSRVTARSKWERNFPGGLKSGCSAIMLQGTVGFPGGYEITTSTAEEWSLLERVVNSAELSPIS